MNTIPRRKLCDIIAQYGISLIDNPMRCRELILDFCGDFQREVFLLNTALFHKIPAELMNSKNILPAAVLVSILAKRLRDTTGLSGESAFWAVESWAIALGLIPEGENTIQFKNVNDQKLVETVCIDDLAGIPAFYHDGIGFRVARTGVFVEIIED